MKKFICIVLAAVVMSPVITGCGEKKETPMVDMNTIEADGSRDDRYIFKKEIEKEENRNKRYNKNSF